MTIYRTIPVPAAYRRSSMRFLCLLAVGVTGILYAEQFEEIEIVDPIVEMDTVTVNAGPIIDAVDIQDTGDKVSVIRRETLDKLNAGDLSAALRRVPGVTVSRYNPVGAYGGSEGGGVFIRGHGAGRPGAQISTMVDGIARFTGVWTHPLLDTLSMDAVKSVEIFKSPQPVNMGNMAFGGVNLISKRASGVGLHGAINASYGSYDTTALVAESGYIRGNFNGYFVVSDRASNGHRDNADGHTNALYGRLGYWLNNRWSAAYTVHYTSAWAHDPEDVTAAKLPITERFEVRSHLHTLTLANVNTNTDQSSGEIKLYYDTGAMRWRQYHFAPPAPFPSQTNHTNTDYANRGLRAHETVPFEPVDVTAGFDADWYGGEVENTYAFAPTTYNPKQTFSTYSPYLLLSKTYALGGASYSDALKLTPSLGARYTMHNEFKAAWGTQAGLKAQWHEHTLYANAAHAYNYAGVYAAIFAGAWGMRADWRDIAPETVDHGELGWRWDFAKKAFIDISIYRDEVRDAIRFSPPPPFPGTIRNIGRYDLTGAEMQLHWAATESLSLFAGTAWQEADDPQVPNVPRWTGSAGLDWTLHKQVTFTVDGQYVDSQNVLNARFPGGQTRASAYALANARLAWSPKIASAYTTELYLIVENLLDRDYSYRPGYPMPGRTLTGGVRVGF
ncbi:MAG: TonB-dependent receptor plug domain-containing protein [Verrucomicrobiota bacterium]|nr:TonB-dependent receptor plug domain-containing protein [Verrucomicrobiota bacterium]